MEHKLTQPQRRLLTRVRETGQLIMNGRARSMIEALEAAGLVDAVWDLDITSTGSTRWRITVTPKEGPA